jgi:hypothetical protein
MTDPRNIHFVFILKLNTSFYIQLNTDYSSVSGNHKQSPSPDTAQPAWNTSGSDDDLPYIPVPKKKRECIPSSTVTTSDVSHSGPGSSNYLCPGENLFSSSNSSIVDTPIYVSSDSVESLPYFKTDHDLCILSSNADDDSDVPPLPPLSERCKLSFIKSTLVSTGTNYLKSAKLKSSEILCSAETLPSSEHMTISYSSPSYESFTLPSSVPSCTSRLSSPSYESVTLPSSVPSNTSQLSSVASSVSTYDASQETVSSVTTMESQHSYEGSSDNLGAKKRKRTPAEVAEQKMLAEVRIVIQVIHW